MIHYTCKYYNKELQECDLCMECDEEQIRECFMEHSNYFVEI